MPSFPGGAHKAEQYSGRYYSAVGSAANQIVKATPGIVGSIVVAGTGVATILDGAVQMCAITAPDTIRWMGEAQTSIIVNAPVTATVSITYD